MWIIIGCFLVIYVLTFSIISVLAYLHFLKIKEFKKIKHLFLQNFQKIDYESIILKNVDKKYFLNQNLGFISATKNRKWNFIFFENEIYDKSWKLFLLPKYLAFRSFALKTNDHVTMIINKKTVIFEDQQKNSILKINFSDILQIKPTIINTKKGYFLATIILFKINKKIIIYNYKQLLNFAQWIFVYWQQEFSNIKI